MVLFEREEQSTPPWQPRDCYLVRNAGVTELLSKDCLYRGPLPVPAAWETFDFDFEFGKYGDEFHSIKSSATWHGLDLSRVGVQSLIARQKERPSHTRVEYKGRARTMNLNLQFYEDLSAGAF